MKKTIRLRPYVIAVLLVTVVFFISEYFLVSSIRNYFLEKMEQEYINYTRVYSHSLTKTAEAYGIINETLEKRLLSASRTAARYAEQITNESLIELADLLEVDEIYVFSPEGEIIYSTREAYLGWQALPGHPVYEFMTSSETALIEEIRADTESGEYYKYGYVKLADGRFVQLGIRAGIVENLLASFEIPRIIEEIASFELVDHVCMIDNEFKIVAGNGMHEIGEVVEDPDIRAAIQAGDTYSTMNLTSPQGEFYEVYVPIYVGDEHVGTLNVGKLTADITAIARTTELLGALVTAGLFLGLIYIMLSNFRHNKKLMITAYQDSLTGLPNKAYLEEVLRDDLTWPEEKSRAILMIHGSNLSEVNSTYGFNIGDQVIKTLAEKVQNLECPGCQLFRFTANRLLIYVRDYPSRDALASLAERVTRVLEDSSNFVERQLKIYVGIVELSGSFSSADELFTQASVALMHAENDPANAYAFYDKQMETLLHRQEIIAAEMAEFLANPTTDTLYLLYQPKVCLSSGQICGFEALARMNSPTFGPVSPGEFIPIAERQDLIIPFGLWAITEACDFINKLREAGYPELHTAVNISVVELYQPDFAQQVQEIIEASGIEPSNLQLEITESMIIEDLDDIRSKLCSLRSLGITIALDDFGTGYSSLARIEDLPIDCIKIDKSFIDKILVKNGQKQIIQDLIAMCHKLGLKVVAEGVEHEEQREYLAASGCDVMQGYLYSKPLGEADALVKLR